VRILETSPLRPPPRVSNPSPRRETNRVRPQNRRLPLWRNPLRNGGRTRLHPALPLPRLPTPERCSARPCRPLRQLWPHRARLVFICTRVLLKLISTSPTARYPESRATGRSGRCDAMRWLTKRRSAAVRHRGDDFNLAMRNRVRPIGSTPSPAKTASPSRAWITHSP
jgi:hypothetical protein